jgi:hypothetical protein
MASRRSPPPEESPNTTLANTPVLDFSKWKTKAFEPVFEKLVRGMKINYPPSGQSSSAPP